MNINYSKILKNNWQAMTLFTVALVVLVAIVSLLQPFEYRAKVNLLIIQKQTATLDAYSAARAAQSLASDLSTVIRTDSFFKKVIGSNSGIDVAWPLQENKRREMWSKMVETGVTPESGILTVSVFQKDPDQAKLIATSIASVLVNSGSEYHGGGDSVSIKIVDPALVSNYPVRPNIIFNILGAIVAGLVLSGGFFLWQAQKNMSDLMESVSENHKHNHNHNHKEISQAEVGRVKQMLADPFDRKIYFDNLDN